MEKTIMNFTKFRILHSTLCTAFYQTGLLASSISIIGIPSRTGKRRPQEEFWHLISFPMSRTGCLHAGQTSNLK